MYDRNKMYKHKETHIKMTINEVVKLKNDNNRVREKHKTLFIWRMGSQRMERKMEWIDVRLIWELDENSIGCGLYWWLMNWKWNWKWMMKWSIIFHHSHSIHISFHIHIKNEGKIEINNLMTDQ